MSEIITFKPPEAELIQQYKDEVEVAIDTTAGSFFDPITHAQDQIHVLELAVAQEQKRLLSDILIALDAATTLSQLSSTLLKLQTWADTFTSAVTVGSLRAERKAAKARRHLQVERDAAKSLIQQVDATRDNYRKLQSKLRP